MLHDRLYVLFARNGSYPLIDQENLLMGTVPGPKVRVRSSTTTQARYSYRQLTQVLQRKLHLVTTSCARVKARKFSGIGLASVSSMNSCRYVHTNHMCRCSGVIVIRVPASFYGFGSTTPALGPAIPSQEFHFQLKSSPCQSFSGILVVLARRESPLAASYSRTQDWYLRTNRMKCLLETEVSGGAIVLRSAPMTADSRSGSSPQYTPCATRLSLSWNSGIAVESTELGQAQ